MFDKLWPATSFTNVLHFPGQLLSPLLNLQKCCCAFLADQGLIYLNYWLWSWRQGLSSKKWYLCWKNLLVFMWHLIIHIHSPSVFVWFLSLRLFFICSILGSFYNLLFKPSYFFKFEGILVLVVSSWLLCMWKLIARRHLVGLVISYGVKNMSHPWKEKKNYERDWEVFFWCYF